MNAAAAVTSPSPQKTSTGMEHHVKTVKQTTGSNRPKCVVQLSQPTGDGVQSASVCAFCSAALPDSVVYCCTSCEINLMQDPHFRMCGEVNDADL